MNLIMSSSAVFLIVCAVLGLILCMPVESRYIKRSAESEPESICYRATPCGWEVYSPHERIIDYFMQSPCECGSGMRCVRTSDDISISAYVYRCRPESEATSESSSDDK